MTATPRPLLLVDPRDLKLHPCRRAVPHDPHGPAIDRLSDSMLQYGFLPEHPIIIHEERRADDSVDRFIVKGEARWLAAKRRQLPQVPCVVSTLPPVTAFLLTLVRCHLSKGAIAYLAVPQLEKANAEGIAMRIKNLRKGQQTPENSTRDNRASTPFDELCLLLDISRAEAFRAKAVWKAFQSDDLLEFSTPEGPVKMTARAWYEPKLLAHHQGDEREGQRPIGLGGILSALEGRESSRPATREEEQLSLFDGAFAKLNSAWLKLKKLGEAKAARQLPDLVAQWDDDLIDAMADAIAKARRERQAQP